MAVVDSNRAEFVRRTLFVVLITLGVVLLVLLVTRLAYTLVLGFLCWILAVGLSIPINALRRRGLKRRQALLVTFVGVFIGLALFVLILLPPIVQQVNNLANSLPSALEAVISEYDDFRQHNQWAQSVLPAFTVEDYQALLNPDAETTGTAGGGLPGIDLGQVLGSALPVLANVGGFLGNIALNLFLIFFITLYLVLDPLVYYRIILAFVPKAREARALEIINKVRETIVSWFGAMVLEVSITAAMVTVALGVLLQIPNAIALGLLAGLANIVPYIGYWAALIPILLFSAATGGLGKAGLAFLLYFIIGIIEANVILPANLNSSLKIPAALTLLFQAIAAALLGFWGILLAVPMLAILMVLARELVVHDTLGKTSVPGVIELPSGELALSPVAEMPLDETIVEKDEDAEKPTPRAAAQDAESVMERKRVYEQQKRDKQ